MSALGDVMNNGRHRAILIMGPTGAGKSSFINVVSGSNLQVGEGLRSCTSSVELSQEFNLDAFRVTLIDTPGFDDTEKSDMEILEIIASFLAASFERGLILTGVIYMHRISDVRMGGTALKNFRMFKALCGPEASSNVTLVTNMWGDVEQDVAESREHQLITDPEFFHQILHEGARIARHDNTRQSAEDIIRRMLGKTPLTLRIQRELVIEGKDISQTAACIELDREMAEEHSKFRRDIVALEEQKQEALRERNRAEEEELEEERERLEDHLLRSAKERSGLSERYNTQKEKMVNEMDSILLPINSEENRPRLMLYDQHISLPMPIAEAEEELNNKDEGPNLSLPSPPKTLPQSIMERSQSAHSRPRSVTSLSTTRPSSLRHSRGTVGFEHGSRKSTSSVLPTSPPPEVKELSQEALSNRRSSRATSVSHRSSMHQSKNGGDTASPSPGVRDSRHWPSYAPIINQSVTIHQFFGNSTRMLLRSTFTRELKPGPRQHHAPPLVKGVAKLAPQSRDVTRSFLKH
ncbi:hypothetical protein C8Q75DRAFT_133143 [Abortiporus biennis]|nr:hypothetical protein C8Q75DRAFT_133143 [Abortiporus biennis]